MNKMINKKKDSIADFWTLRKPKGRLEIKSVTMHKQPHTAVSKIAITNKRWTKRQQNHKAVIKSEAAQNKTSNCD